MKKFLRKIMQTFEIAGYARAAQQLATMGYMEEAKRLMVEECAKRQTFKDLNALTDKELKDIGISRGQIYDIAYNNADRKSAA